MTEHGGGDIEPQPQDTRQGIGIEGVRGTGVGLAALMDEELTLAAFPLQQGMGGYLLRPSAAVLPLVDILDMVPIPRSNLSPAVAIGMPTALFPIGAVPHGGIIPRRLAAVARPAVEGIF